MITEKNLTSYNKATHRRENVFLSSDQIAMGNVTLTHKISTIDSDITTLRSTTGGHTSNIGTIQSDILTLRSDIENHTTDITTLQGNISNLRDDVGALQSSRAMIASPTFTGTPKAPTQEATDNSRNIATTEFVQRAIQQVIGDAPENLNTLQELAAALSDNPNMSSTVLSSLSNKQDAHNNLTIISNATFEAEAMYYTTATNTLAKVPSTAFGRAFLNVNNQDSACLYLGAVRAGTKIANATHADSADNATNADNAKNAENAAEAEHAAKAETATEADSATNATNATNAKEAEKAEKDSQGNTIHTSYIKLADRVNLTSSGPIDSNYNKVVDARSLANWNGTYVNATSSSLAYCKLGAFGSIVTKNSTDYVAANSSGYIKSITLNGNSINVTDGSNSSKTLSIYPFASSVAPTSPASNQVWFDSTSQMIQYRNGTAWVPFKASGVSSTAPVGGTAELVHGTMASSDYFRILVGGNNDSGYVELATADNGKEPIYVRQYSGSYDFTTLVRTATLLDGSGNTSFPGTVTAPTFSGELNGNAKTATSASKVTGGTITLSGDATGTASFGSAGNMTLTVDVKPEATLKTTTADPSAYESTLSKIKAPGAYRIVDAGNWTDRTTNEGGKLDGTFYMLVFGSTSRIQWACPYSSGVPRVRAIKNVGQSDETVFPWYTLATQTWVKDTATAYQAKTITETLPVSKGGTGATTSVQARQNIFPGGAQTTTATHLVSVITGGEGGNLAQANVPGWLGFSHGNCTTAAATAAKAATGTNFILRTGAWCTVKFTKACTATSPTLNVNSTGAKPIFYNNAALASGVISANTFHMFVYDGTNWNMIA